MPMKTELYVSNWKTIHLIIKYLADWHCEKCDRPCRRPEEEWDTFCSKLLHDGSIWYKETFEEFHDEETGKWGIAEKPGRFVLTVAHLDQNPGNNDRENLRALCPTCHNRHDAPHRAKNRSHTLMVKKESAGQLRLEGL